MRYILLILIAMIQGCNSIEILPHDHDWAANKLGLKVLNQDVIICPTPLKRGLFKQEIPFLMLSRAVEGQNRLCPDVPTESVISKGTEVQIESLENNTHTSLFVVERLYFIGTVKLQTGKLAKFYYWYGSDVERFETPWDT